MNYKFTFKFYHDLLLSYSDVFNLISYGEKLTSNKNLILRHDLDGHLNNALKMAKIENKIGIKSTYFLRLHGHYNPFFYKNKKILMKILDLGHYIGLHVDSDYWFSKKIDYLECDYDFMKTNLNHENVVSFYTNHMPNQMQPYSVSGKLICVDFYKNFDYISDSGGHLNRPIFDGLLCQNLVINTHPSWWFKKTPLENF